jgi:hypothetical protein
MDVLFPNLTNGTEEETENGEEEVGISDGEIETEKIT